MLKVDKINKAFTVNGSEKNILNNITFTIEDGEFVCILGPSGSGKTTLLRCIGGFEALTNGNMLLDGQSIYAPGIDRIMVFQGFEQLFGWKTVEANVEYPLKINLIDKGNRQQLVGKYISMVGLENYKNYYPHQLSGGMKQRAAIARALALEPRILLMDEPFGNLDAQTRNSLQNELLKIWSDLKTTILFVTHDIEEAIILSDRIIMLSTSGELKNIIPNRLERPRKPGSIGFAELWDLLYNQLGH